MARLSRPKGDADDARTQQPAVGVESPLLAPLLNHALRENRLVHVEHLPARPGATAPWPPWADPVLVHAWRRLGVDLPWEHQVRAAEAIRSGRHVALGTGTASGKSLAYLLPVLSALLEGAREPGGRQTTACYLAPTKALAADQLASIHALAPAAPRAATYDGDTAPEERRWVRDHAALVLTNPDMLHHSMLPGHARWAPFWRRLRYVVIDEAHAYRGVFGSHVAAVLRRVRRVCAHYGSSPVFVLASATLADPTATAQRLLGLDDVTAVVDDTSPRGASVFALWEPPLLPGGGENGAPRRRSAVSETADLLADLVSDGRRTIAFVPSRRGAEVVASTAQRLLAEVDPALSRRVAPYRAGYLPEDRRVLEADLRQGRLLAVAATTALELGIDIAGLDAVIICGWPGRRASLWQQAGRAGRRGGEALAVLVARDDPLDTYLVHHPEAIFGPDVEQAVLDPENPYVLAPHLCAAAAEVPLTAADLPAFGSTARELVDSLVARGVLRARRNGWYWTQDTRASDLADLRGTGQSAVRIVEVATGRLLGTVEAGSAHHSLHTGAVYLHQGTAYLVRRLDLDEGVAIIELTDDTISTSARERIDIRVLTTREQTRWGVVTLSLGTVEVTSQVVSYLRRDTVSGAVLGEEPLDLPQRRLRTTAVWWTMPPALLAEAGVPEHDIPGAAHAAEHAAIGLLPMLASCDRWDVGGVSTAGHADTGLPTIFVHDGHPGGAGFAERGYLSARAWLEATAAAIAACECKEGCPSCVQSPKCGNGNHPLSKDGAGRLLHAVLAQQAGAGCG